MILAAQPFVVIQFNGEVYLVAGSAKLCALVERFQKSFLVKLRFRLDQLTVQPTQKLTLTEGERIVDRLVDRIIGVPAG